MKYSTRISARQVLLAFDLYIKRRQVLASKHPGHWVTLKKYGHKPLDEPTPLPANLSLKAIAARCQISTSTLARLIEGEFRLTKLNRAKLVKWVQKFYRP